MKRAVFDHVIEPVMTGAATHFTSHAHHIGLVD
jgi:hypothetical protein